MHKSPGGRHIRFPLTKFDAEADVQSGSCLLYAMLIEHVDPIPVEDETEEQVAKSMSSVPSRSTKAQ